MTRVLITSTTTFSTEIEVDEPEDNKDAGDMLSQIEHEASAEMFGVPTETWNFESEEYSAEWI